MQDSALYYLPGRGGRLGSGLGTALIERKLSVAGRETVGVPVTVVPQAGHMLPKDYVTTVLDRWLGLEMKVCKSS
jgi:hypothetical protein